MSESAFQMIHVGRKRITRRRAVAMGEIRVGHKAFQAIETKSLPKGDVLSLAEIAGIMGAKKTADLLPMCHNLPLDQVLISCVPQPPDRIVVYAQACAQVKTGVEMEAIMAAQTALACIWDLVKGTKPDLEIDNIRLLVKEGGKSGLWVNPDGIPDWLESQLNADLSLTGKTAEIVVMSDRAAGGDYEDESGPLLKNLVQDAGGFCENITVIPDDQSIIRQTLSKCADEKQPDLILASGGTGPGPRDVTPEIVTEICDRMLDGLGEVLRRESAAFTDTAWLSRMCGGMRGRSLIVALPGSPKAVRECWEILEMFLGHSLNMIAGQGHKKKDSKTH